MSRCGGRAAGHPGLDNEPPTHQQQLFVVVDGGLIPLLRKSVSLSGINAGICRLRTTLPGGLTLFLHLFEDDPCVRDANPVGGVILEV